MIYFSSPTPVPTIYDSSQISIKDDNV